MKDRVLMIVGGSSDIGHKILNDLYSQYDKIIIHSYSTDINVEELKGEREVFVYKADLRDLNSTRCMIEQIMNDNNIPTDLIYLPAGKYEMKQFSQFTIDKFDTELTIGVKSLVIMLQAFLPHMKKKRFGKILVMLSSIVEGIPPKYISYYIVSKYALLGLVKSIDVEYYEYGIEVNAISPDMIETRFWREIPEFIIQQIIQEKYKGVPLSIEKVAKVISGLLLENEDNVHGNNIVIK